MAPVTTAMRASRIGVDRASPCDMPGNRSSVHGCLRLVLVRGVNRSVLAWSIQKRSRMVPYDTRMIPTHTAVIDRQHHRSQPYLCLRQL